MDVEGQMAHSYPSCRKAMKFMLFLLHMATSDICILLKKYTTNQNCKGKGYVFKDFIPACVQKMMEAAEVEDEKDSADSAVHQQHRHYSHTKTADNGSSCLQVGLKMNKMADVPPSEKKKVAALRRFSICSAHT